MAELMRRSCVLCGEEASVYCPSDAAHLCQMCDEKVHSANFLVARHVRVCVCPPCLASGSVKGGVCCRSRSLHAEEEEVDDDDEEDCLTSSSSCVSSTGEESASASSTSSRRKRRDRKNTTRGRGGGRMRMRVAIDMKVEATLVNWSRSLGVDDTGLVHTAAEILNGCSSKMTILPFRVSLATAFWLAMRLYGTGTGTTSTCQMLRQLEQISGVPAKLIIATEPRMTRVVKRRQSREDHEEGWAES